MDKTILRQGVSVVIPNYNGKELLAENLPKVLAAARNPKNQILEVIVVDDYSSDDSVKVIEKEYPEITIIRHKANRGFSASVNTGVRQAKFPLVALLNSDVYPEKEFLVKPIQNFEDTRVFAVNFHTRGFGYSLGIFKDGFIGYKAGIESKEKKDTFFANGGGSLYKRKVWMELGGMDEKLLSPFYWEDVDLSYRALKRGYKIVWQPESYISPNLSATISSFSKKRVQVIQERNQLLFIWKNLTSQNLFRKHLIGLLKRTLKHPGYIKIVVMAILKIVAVVKARRKEVKECKVSDEAILARF